MSGTHSTFASLLTLDVLYCIVSFFVHRTDLTHLRLVCKDWKNVVSLDFVHKLNAELQQLYLNRNGISTTDINRILADLSRVREVKSGIDPICYFSDGRLPVVRRGSVIHCLSRYKPAFLSSFRCGAFPSVNSLDMSGCHMTDDEVATLVSCHDFLSQLRVLDLQLNVMEDDGARALAEVIARGGMKRLHKLILRNNFIQKAGMAALAQACCRGGMDDLEVILLAGNAPGDHPAFTSLVTSVALPKLKLLSIDKPPEHLWTACHAKGIDLNHVFELSRFSQQLDALLGVPL